MADPTADKLLDRLLYRGVLPRYAFPTDVASFYVFNRDLSTPFRPKMLFAPSQGLTSRCRSTRPNWQIVDPREAIHVKGNLFAIPRRAARRMAAAAAVLRVHAVRSREDGGLFRGKQGRGPRLRSLPRARHFGPAKRWFRPPGFAHPIDQIAVSTPEMSAETAFATRAKLVMTTPAAERAWTRIAGGIRALAAREHLLVSNSAPTTKGEQVLYSLRTHRSGCGSRDQPVAAARAAVSVERTRTVLGTDGNPWCRAGHGFRDRHLSLLAEAGRTVPIATGK